MLFGGAQTYLQDIFTNKKFLVVVFISALFLAAAVYVYMYYVSPKLNPDFVPNREFVKEKDDGRATDATMYFFYTNWCPHSKKSKPIWDEVKKEYDGKEINGITVHFVEVNGEESESSLGAFEKQHKVKIDGYPTIYLVKGDQIIEYDAKPTRETLREFLSATL
jgi:thiol-disulfide isomerase/thioredoxin